MRISLLLTALLMNLLNNVKSNFCTPKKKSVSLKEASTTNNRDAGKYDWHSYSHSPVDLLFLTNLEKDLFAIVKEYVVKLDKEPEYLIKRYIIDYETSSLVAFKMADGTKVKDKNIAIHTNPLWSFRMIWRFVTDFPKIRNILLSSGNSEISKAFQDRVPALIVWPSKRDLDDSMDNLLNLHYIYDLNLKEFANGILGNAVTNSNLSAIHCFEISKYALRNKQYTLAIEWLEIAEKKALDVNGDPILDYLERTSIRKLLIEIVNEHDANWKNEGPTPFNLFKYVAKIDSEYILMSQKKALQSEHRSKGAGNSYPFPDDVSAFSSLCKGGNLQTEKEKSTLYCWYEYKIHSSWYMNLQKMELHSQDPYIVQVHDFIGYDLIEYLKKEAIPSMEKSQIAPTVHNQDVYTNYRMSMNTLLHESKNASRLQILSQRIGYLTGLNPSYAGSETTNVIQIAAYATGGYFNIHLDSLKGTNIHDELVADNIGDRLATFMLYLNDVELGGKTAFTSAGVAVPAVKGSAIFWYNSKYSGEVEHKVWHGGCPVLLGEKWVATKWIHNNLNIFKRKCSLNKDE